MIKLYDTKRRAKVEFSPTQEGKVGIYVCGPTVYNYIHIGNARTFISFDMIRRYFVWRGYQVCFVQNITDVDDKIITKAQEEETSAAEIARTYTQAFIEDMRSIDVLDPDIRPKATEEIDSMIELISELIESNHAYAVEGDVYFSVRSFPSYGELSGRKVDEMESGHRELRADGKGLEGRKRDPLDFALWKAAKEGEPAWESPWGSGRPGWHIECSAMSRKYLGLPFDIHGGGADLVFPHHENERAQSEAACSCTFANHWMHGGMLQINAEKMSKSLGNFMLLREVLKTTSAPVLRMLMMQTHYRSPLDFSDERLLEAESALGRIENAVKNITWLIENANEGGNALNVARLNAGIDGLIRGFVSSMDDDFNTAEALGVVFSYINNMNTGLSGQSAKQGDIEVLERAKNTLIELMAVLGVRLRVEEAEETYPVEVIKLAEELASYSGSDTAEAVQILLEAREEARKQKNWALADGVRDGFSSLGLRIEDTPQGARIAREA
ncbi:MAG: cysteine--tRNA ligase [Raoultibacter sp.]|jgi:cysteinyl-tRNA synthetase